MLPSDLAEEAAGWESSGHPSYHDGVVDAPDAADWLALTDAPLPVEAVVAWATTPAAGAVVSFLGVVRDHSEGRDGVVGMDS